MKKKGMPPKQIKTSAALLYVLAVGIAYYIFTKVTGFYIPCPIRSLTGFACPGCGISHFFSDLLSLDFTDAVRQNAALAILIPTWILFSVIYLLLKSKTAKKTLFSCVTWGSIVFLLIFGVLRNIPSFSFLLPLYMR